jgi:AAA domain/Bifunctional DNA primase/polymerase, N-terminal
MSTAMFAAEMVVKASWQFPSSEAFRAKIAEWSPTSSKEDLDAAVAAYKENAVTQEIPGQPNLATESQEIVSEWETPAHKEVDPFDADYNLVNAQTSNEPQPGLIPFVNTAIEKGFHIFGLTPKDKVTLPGSHGFKDSKAPSDPLALSPWEQDPNRNIGIDLGASDLCVLDFDKPQSIPAWLNGLKTYKVRTGKGVHMYFRGARKTTKLYVDGNVVGDVKSTGGYVLAAGSVHPSSAIYTIIDNSSIAALPERVSELVRHDSERVNASADGPPIPYGSHDTELFRIGCMLRNAGMNYQEIRDALIHICQRRCENYGSDYVDMCEKKAKSACRYPVGQASPILLLEGNPVGQTATATTVATQWRDKFKSVGELEEGEVVMLISGFLPEGTAFIGGLPGEGKTFFALSITRALTTGKPFLGHFMVPKTVPVIYLIPESGGRAFRKRCEKFEIPDDPDKFLCRTVSEGSTLPLDDTSLLEAIRRLKPVVILDTIIRFSESEDENAAAQNKKLVDDVIRLRQAGAIAVIGLHHATKKMRTEGMSLELALRGTGDIAASADAVYGLLRDSMLYNNGAGPNEIAVACLKPRDFEPPPPFRIAASRKQSGYDAPQDDGTAGLIIGLESIIDNEHDFKIISRVAQASQVAERVEKLVLETPTVTLKELHEMTGISLWELRKTLGNLGYHRGRGGKKGATHWTKEPEKVDTSTIRVESDEPSELEVVLDQVAA